jgi:hypothetical protein
VEPFGPADFGEVELLIARRIRRQDLIERIRAFDLDAVDAVLVPKMSALRT